MSSIRLQLRDAIRHVVTAAAPIPVFTNIDYALDQGAAPCIVLHTGDDSGDRSESWSREMGGRSEAAGLVELHILVDDVEDPEAAADPFETAIHAALLADSRLGGLSIDLERVGGGFERDLGQFTDRVLIYRVTYRVQTNNLERTA
jgi:hypothetical protein